VNKIILIGGAAGTGKSTLAQQLSEHLQISWISTDQIRAILGVHEKDENKQSELVWKGVLRLIKRGPFPWKNGMIVEGVAILPKFVSLDCTELSICPIFLKYENDDQISKLIKERSKLSWIKTKTIAQQKQKIKEISLLNGKILYDAGRLGYPCVNIQSQGLLLNVLKLIEV